jgi:solute carrier family 35 protein
VRRRPLYEVVGQLGMWGVIISGIQASIIEHHKMNEVTWSGRNSTSLYRRVEYFTLTLGFLVGLLFGYTAGMDIVTSLDCKHADWPHSDVHLVYRSTSALSSRLIRIFQLELALQ